MRKFSSKSRNLSTLFIIFSLILVGCVGVNAPRQMLTGTVVREDSTTSTTFKELTAPGITVINSETSVITALFVAECRVSSAGQKLEVRIKIDDQVAKPGVSILTTDTQYETHSLLATKKEVPPGTHMVTVEWRVSKGSAFVRNRSFTVWEVR